MTAKERVKITEKAETAYIKNLESEYRKAYREIQKDIASFGAKYAVDGKLDVTESQKFNRLQNLEKAVAAELAKITAMNEGQIAAYMTNQYEFNYFYEGYILEQKYQVKLAFGPINREAVRASVVNPLDKVSGLTNKQQLRQRVSSAITQGIVKGDSVRTTSKIIREAMQTNLRAAERIVRTETTKAMNQGEIASMEHAADRGLPIQKEWLATLDGRTRESHASIDGQVRELDEAFSNGLMYPGDPSGPASEVINCRCTMTEVIKDLDLPEQSRRAKEDGDYKVIPKMTFKEWQKARAS